MMRLKKDFINKLPQLFLLIAMLNGNILSPLYAFADDVLPEKKGIQDFKLEEIDSGGEITKIAAMIRPMAIKPTFPSTNDDNITKSWGNVKENEKTPGETEFLITSTRNFLSCFEYRTDGDTSQKVSDINFNAEITDGRYPHICVQNVEKTLTLKASTYVEFRLSFGAEKDERFDWTRFDVISKPSTPTNGSPHNISIPTNNFDFNWDVSTGVEPIKYEFQSSLNPAESNGILTTGLWKSNVLPNNMIHSSGAQDGKWYWQVRAIDNNGNKSGSEIWNVLLDTITPTKPIWTAPENNLMTNINNITLKWDSTDTASGIKGYYFRYVHTSENGIVTNWQTGFVASTGNSRTGSYGHGNGKYEIYVKTVDNAGNVSEESDSLTITYDGTAPAVPTGLYFKAVDNDNTVVACGGYSNTRHITEHWEEITGDDSFSHYEYSSFDAPNGNPGKKEEKMDTNSFNSAWWNIPQEGTFGFQVRSVDKAGNKSDWAGGDVGINNSCTINIDWTPPKTPTLTSPENGAYVQGASVTNVWEAIDDADHYEYESYHDKDLQYWRWDETFNTNSKTATNVANATFYWRVRAVDKAGNKSDWSEVWKLTVDNTPPSGEIKGIRYDKGDVAKFITNDKSPLLYGTYSDNYEIDDIKVYIGNIEATVGYSEGNWTAKFTDLLDGVHEVTLKVTDKAGNIYTTTQEIRVDSIPPRAEYTHYIDGEIFTDTTATVKYLSQLTFTAVYTDEEPSSGLTYDSFAIFQAQEDGSFGFAQNGKIGYCSWRKDPNRVTLSRSTYSQTEEIAFTKCIAELPDGEYYMAHQVYDNAVRKDIPTITQFRDVLGLHFFIENTPEITLSSPYTEVEVGTGSFEITATVKDGNSPINITWTGPDSFTAIGEKIIFTPTKAGTFTYTAKVIDANGDTDEKNITIIVKALPESSTENDNGEVAGVTTTNTKTSTTNRTARNTVTLRTNAVETTAEEVDDTQEVLGEEEKIEESCEANKKISGNIYIDKNNNDKLDKGEKGIKNIKVQIYVMENGEKKIIKEVTTDKDGYFETTGVCEGKYNIQVEEETLPKGHELKGEATREIVVTNTDTEENEGAYLGVSVEDNRSFIQKYWYLILIIPVIGYVIFKKRKENK